jgi:hypothetical protein
MAALLRLAKKYYVYRVSLSRDDMWMVDVDLSGRLAGPRDLVDVAVRMSVAELWRRHLTGSRDYASIQYP